MAVGLLVFALLAQDGSFETLWQRFDAATKSQDRAAVEQQLVGLQREALNFINADKLKTGEEFRRVSSILIYSGNTFPVTQTKYETLLTALSLGDSEAKKTIAESWDYLMVGMSRNRRIGVQKGAPEGERWKVRETAKSILAVYRGEPSKSSIDNAEVKAIVEADQAVRQQDWSKLKASDFERLARDDSKRLKRIKDILKAGAVRTANDFDRAALVCQHGETFDDYALAHELSVCSMLLGQKSASWLAGASYDRMLVNAGLPQRFATQYSIDFGVTSLTRVDSDGINDTERRAVVHLTLQQARDRKWD